MAQTLPVTAELLAQLAILALIDSTSIGTLVIPVWLLLRRDSGGRAAVTGKAAAYLAAIGLFYFLLGLGLLTGVAGAAGAWGADLGALGGLPAVQWGMLVAGGGLLAWAVLGGRPGRGVSTPTEPPFPSRMTGSPDTARLQGRGARAERSSGVAAAQEPGPSPVEARWQRRIGRAVGTPGGLLGLALLAGLLEVPTMLPYIGAIGLLTTSSAGWALSAALLGAYCLVMLLPAGLLVAGRLALGSVLDAPLARLGAWLSRVAGEAVLWVAGIVGFLMLRAALAALFPDAAWNPFG